MMLVPLSLVSGWRAAPSPQAPRDGAVATSVPGIPVRLRIPILGIDAVVEPVGLVAGAMDVPVDAGDVGWYRLGPRPGATGNAVIDGHLTSAAGAAVFFSLSRLR